MECSICPFPTRSFNYTSCTHVPKIFVNPCRNSDNWICQFLAICISWQDSTAWCVCSYCFLYEPENDLGRNHYCSPHNANQTVYNKLRTFLLACYSHSAYCLCRVASWSKCPVLIFRANDSIWKCFIL